MSALRDPNVAKLNRVPPPSTRQCRGAGTSVNCHSCPRTRQPQKHVTPVTPYVKAFFSSSRRPSTRLKLLESPHLFKFSLYVSFSSTTLPSTPFRAYTFALAVAICTGHPSRSCFAPTELRPITFSRSQHSVSTFATPEPSIITSTLAFTLPPLYIQSSRGRHPSAVKHNPKTF